MSAHHPATAQRAGITIKVALAEGQTFQNALGFRFVLPPVVLVQMTSGQFEHRQVIHRSAFLRQEAKDETFFHGHLTIVRSALAQQQGEKGGFTRAVGADQTNGLSAIDVKRHPAEKRASCVGLAGVGDG